MLSPAPANNENFHSLRTIVLTPFVLVRRMNQATKEKRYGPLAIVSTGGYWLKRMFMPKAALPFADGAVGRGQPPCGFSRYFACAA